MTVGTKLVCTNANFNSHVLRYYRMLPKLGDIYTVRSVSVSPSPDCAVDEPTILLNELYNPLHPIRKRTEVGFSVRRFTPAVDVSTPSL